MDPTTGSSAGNVSVVGFGDGFTASSVFVLVIIRGSDGVFRRDNDVVVEGNFDTVDNDDLDCDGVRSTVLVSVLRMVPLGLSIFVAVRVRRSVCVGVVIKVCVVEGTKVKDHDTLFVGNLERLIVADAVNEREGSSVCDWVRVSVAVVVLVLISVQESPFESIKYCCETEVLQIWFPMFATDNKPESLG